MSRSRIPPQRKVGRNRSEHHVCNEAADKAMYIDTYRRSGASRLILFDGDWNPRCVT